MVKTKDEVLKKLEENLPYIKREYGVKRLGIFGSFAKDIQDEHSDIDIITEFERPIGLKFIEFANYIEQILGRKTDILTMVGITEIRNKKIATNIKESIVYV